MPRARTGSSVASRGELLEAALTGFKNMRLRSAIEKCHVIVGTFGELKAGVGSTSLAGKTVITSAVDDERLAWFKDCARPTW
jgi:hypothetical protein